jgi:hypothetical protein
VGLAEGCRELQLFSVREDAKRMDIGQPSRVSREDQLLTVKVKSFLSLLVKRPSTELCSSL